ncbi:MAG: FUSC family protein [Rhodanobacter sp.]
MALTATLDPSRASQASASRALREAVVTMLAALATLACVLAIDATSGSAVLAVVLCLSLSRSQLDRDMRGRLEAAIVLPLVGLVAVGVGTLLLRLPWIGAAVFVGGLFLAIWLRKFGPLVRRAGSLLVLPFVAILVTPYAPTRHAGSLMTLLLPVLVALLALFWVSVSHALARSVKLLPDGPSFAVHAHAETPAPPSSMRPVASTRMAIQMAVALAASFLAGYLFFAERWGWIVLTAFIVNSGNRGRLDVAYKSVLRVAGAATGTLTALVFTVQLGSHDPTTVLLILLAVFLGIWLRPLGYAWWALFVTIALALLQGFEGTSARLILGLRLEEIVIGAIIGIAAAWLVYPVRSIDVMRRRIADALARLGDAFDPAVPQRSAQGFIAALAAVNQVAPAFRASRLATQRFQPLQPADWVDALLACRDPAIALIQKNARPGQVRQDIGAARRALREPAQLLAALEALRHSLVYSTRRGQDMEAGDDGQCFETRPDQT